MRHDFHFYEFHMIASHQLNISERMVDEGQEIRWWMMMKPLFKCQKFQYITVLIGDTKIKLIKVKLS